MTKLIIGSSCDSSVFRKIDEICDRFERELMVGRRPNVFDYLSFDLGESTALLLRELRSLQRLYERKGASAANHPKSIGRYSVLCELGRGAFGCVYLANDSLLERRVAVKIAYDTATSFCAEDFLAREAQLLARLDHTGVVPVYDSGHTDNGIRFFVSKYIDGENLKAVLHRGLSCIDAALISAEVADVLAIAHEHGIVHRDIKPENILFDKKHRVYVSDFGLATRINDSEESKFVGGSPAYMSPEQACGNHVDGRSDIYSLGIILYEAITGSRIFKNRIAENEVPGQLKRVCLRAIEKDPDCRPRDAGEFASELRMAVGLCKSPKKSSGQLSSFRTASLDRGEATSCQFTPAFDDYAWESAWSTWKRF